MSRQAIVIVAAIAIVTAGTGVLLHAGTSGRQDHPSPTPPAGMVFVPGGATRVGSNEGTPDEQPAFRVHVKPFFMDAAPVTVAQFRSFVQTTGHITSAEQMGDGAVLDAAAGAWRLVPGASWQRPLGPAGPAAPDDHPVTQVSWHDAAAYAEWAGKRLPTEIEWEHAARGANDARSPYFWGDDAAEGRDGRHKANLWQGRFPAFNTGGDGYLLTSPVGAFGASPLGLTDLAGNVWEWTASWYRPYADREQPYSPGKSSERVQRGGSFLCHESVCHGYRVSARGHSTPETASFHVGFRLVKDLDRD